MVRNILIIGALALSAPAFAQEQQPPEQPETTAPASPAPANHKDAVAAVVQSEFATYDTDKSGDLNEPEFSGWLIALKTQSDGEKAKPADLKKWAETAFAQADTDHSKAVSPAELTAFLQG